MMKNLGKILKQFASKKERLQKVLASQNPINPNLYSAHERKLTNANFFLSELTEAENLLLSSGDIRLVTLSTLEKQIEKADFSSMEFDGEFCKIALIENYPYDSLWLLWIAPVESI